MAVDHTSIKQLVRQVSILVHRHPVIVGDVDELQRVVDWIALAHKQPGDCVGLTVGGDVIALDVNFVLLDAIDGHGSVLVGPVTPKRFR